jgi:hypothetical protein
MSNHKDTIDAEVVDEKEESKSNEDSFTSDDVKKSLNTFITQMDNLSQVVKILLALPFIDIIWVIYRLIKSIAKDDVLGLVLAIVAIIVGVPFLWVIDMICIAVMGHVWWLD